MGCGCRGGGSATVRTTTERWVVTLADGTQLPYAVEWEARQAQKRNPGSTYALVRG